MTTSVNSTATCRWCGLIHTGNGICPTVKAIEYFEDGQIKRVEFKTPADYALPPLQPWPQPGPWYPYGPVTWGGNTTTTTGVDY